MMERFGFAARRWAEGEDGLRVRARMWNVGDSGFWADRRDWMRAPPCLPVAPQTRMERTDGYIMDFLSPRFLEGDG